MEHATTQMIVNQVNARSTSRPWCLALLLTGLAGGSLSTQAETYLSIDETLKVCFPDADRFESRKITLSAKQIALIRNRIDKKIRWTDVRFWLASARGKPLGLMVFDHVYGRHELIDYAVALSLEGRVEQVELLAYRETYGEEIHDEKWRHQFVGKAPESRLKFNEDIYNISGATISCRTVTRGIERVLATFDLVLRPLLVADGWMPKPAQGNHQHAEE